MIETPRVPAMTDESGPHEPVVAQTTLNHPEDNNLTNTNNTEDNDNNTSNTPIKQEEPSSNSCNTMTDYDSFPVDAKGEVIIPADADVEAFFTVVDADDDQHDCGICGKETLDEENRTTLK